MKHLIVATVCLAVFAGSCCHKEQRELGDQQPQTPTTNNSAPATTAAATAASPTAAATTSAPAPKATGLTATFSPDGASFASSVDAQINATVTNQGPEPIEVRMDYLSSAILSLDVLDASGKRMMTIPPPMPLPPDKVERAKKMLAPGQSERFTYYLHIFSPKLSAGTYTVRMRSIPAKPATFVIRP